MSSMVPNDGFQFELTSERANATLMSLVPSTTAFTAGWRDKWGAAPGTDSDLNSHVYLCERTSGKGSDWTNHVLFAPGATAEQAGNGFEDWRVVRPIKGDVRFHTLALKYVADQDAFARWGEDSPALSPTALGHCFAAPDEHTS